jgi:hypothetical protein
MVGDHDAGGRGRAAVLRAGGRDRYRQGVGVRHDPGAERVPEGRPAAGDPRVRHHAQAAARAGGLAALLGRGAGRDGIHQRLLEAGVLPAGAGGLRVPALPGLAGQGAARAAQDRQAGLGMAREDHRAGIAGGQLRAAGGDPAAAHPHPLPAAPDPGPHGGEGALREAAGGRAPEAVVGDQRHPRGLRPGDAPRDHRGRARPEGARGDGRGRESAARSPGSRRPWTARSSPPSTPSSFR